MKVTIDNRVHIYLTLPRVVWNRMREERARRRKQLGGSRFTYSNLLEELVLQYCGEGRSKKISHEWSRRFGIFGTEEGVLTDIVMTVLPLSRGELQ